MSQDLKIDPRVSSGWEILVVIFDLLDVCSSQFDMTTIADWQLSGRFIMP